MKTFRLPICSEGSIEIKACSEKDALKKFEDMDCKELWDILHNEGIFCRDDLIEEVQ